MNRASRLPWVAALAAVILHGLSSLRLPVGAAVDEAYFLLLARSLRHGAYAAPNAAGIPVTDPLPGFPLLMTIPTWLLEPHWLMLRAFSLAATAAVVLLSYRLALRLLEPRVAGWAAILCAGNTTLAQLGGQAAPDIPFLALSLFLIDRLAARPGPPDLVMILGAALAALMRPHGLLLAFCLSLASGWRWGWRRGVSMLVLTLMPLGFWLARNLALASTGSAYADNWRAQILGLSDVAVQLRHIVEVFRTFLSEGLLGLSGVHPAVEIAAAVGLMSAAILGARRLLREKTEPWVFALVLFPALIFCLHATWKPLFPRYAIPLITPLWIFIAAGFQRPAKKPGSLIITAAVLAVIWTLGRVLPLAWAGLREPQLEFQPRTMAWIRERTAPTAKFQSLMPASLTLLTGRPAYLPDVRRADRQSWEDSLHRQGFNYVCINRSWLTSDGFLPPGALAFIARYQPWSEASPSLSLVFDDPGEETLIFAVASQR